MELIFLSFLYIYKSCVKSNIFFRQYNFFINLINFIVQLNFKELYALLYHKYKNMKKNQIISHLLTKTITESDNNIFSLITMNHHPVHSNK